VRVLLSVLLLAGASATSAREDAAAREYGGVTGAALEALRGHATQARAMLTSGKVDPADPGALVVLASIALDEGDLRAQRASSHAFARQRLRHRRRASSTLS
jgi:hypothetical protein